MTVPRHLTAVSRLDELSRVRPGPTSRLAASPHVVSAIARGTVRSVSARLAAYGDGVNVYIGIAALPPRDSPIPSAVGPANVRSADDGDWAVRGFRQEGGHRAE